MCTVQGADAPCLCPTRWIPVFLAGVKTVLFSKYITSFVGPRSANHHPLFRKVGDPERDCMAQVTGQEEQNAP